MSEKMHRHCDQCGMDFARAKVERWFTFDDTGNGMFTAATFELKIHGGQKRVKFPLDFCSVGCLVNWLDRHGVHE